MGAGDQALLHTYSAHESHLNHISLSACWISFAPPPEKNTSVFPCVSPPRALSLSGKGLRFLFFVSLAGITPIVAIPLETPPLPHKNKQARTLCPFFFVFFWGAILLLYLPPRAFCSQVFGGLLSPRHNRVWGTGAPKHKRVWGTGVPQTQQRLVGLAPPKLKRVWGIGSPQTQKSLGDWRPPSTKKN